MKRTFGAFAAAVVFCSLQTFADVQPPVVDALLRTSNTLRFVTSVPLANKQYPLFHPQGVKVIGREVYVSTVEGTSTGYGHLIKFELDSANAPTLSRPIARVTFDPGPNKKMIHSGGTDIDGESLLIALAEYDTSGPGLLVRVDLKTFKGYEEIAKIDDHIGAVINDANTIFMMNWDSKDVYGLDKQSGLPSVTFKGNGWNYQDCKNVSRGYALCSALKGKLIRKGEIHLLHYPSAPPYGLEIVKQIPVDKFNSDGSPGGGRPLTNNAMDFAPLYDATTNQIIGIRFYFVPHDDKKARLMIYDSML